MGLRSCGNDNIGGSYGGYRLPAAQMTTTKLDQEWLGEVATALGSIPEATLTFESKVAACHHPFITRL